MRELWRVWLENEKMSELLGVIANEQVMFEGSETRARQFYRQEGGVKRGLHIGKIIEDTVETRVIFKMLEGECIAFLLDMDANPYHILSYMHIGQHGEASMSCFQNCRLATEEEYSDLRKELEGMGYRLYLRERWNGKRI